MAKKRQTKKKRQAAGGSGVLALFLILVLLVIAAGAMVRMISLRRQAWEAAAAAEAAPTPEPTLPPTVLSPEGFGWGAGLKSYEYEGVTGHPGVDVSGHQGEIDWQAVAASGVEFAILRAGYRGYGDGDIHEDERFLENLRGARDAGLELGVYYFSQALTEAEAMEEASHAVALLDGERLEYPIFFDWEPISEENSRSLSYSGSQLTACALAFCRTVREAGYQGGVYFNLAQAAGVYHLYDLRNETLWLAEYQEVPSFPFRFSCWQYRSDGEIPGIAGPVDLNLFFS